MYSCPGAGLVALDPGTRSDSLPGDVFVTLQVLLPRSRQHRACPAELSLVAQLRSLHVQSVGATRSGPAPMLCSHHHRDSCECRLVAWRFDAAVGSAGALWTP
jgi:hypothetical protein